MGEDLYLGFQPWETNCDHTGPYKILSVQNIKINEQKIFFVVKIIFRDSRAENKYY